MQQGFSVRPRLDQAADLPTDRQQFMQACTALYAGAEVGRIRSVMPAAEVVRELAAAFDQRRKADRAA